MQPNKSKPRKRKHYLPEWAEAYGLKNIDLIEATGADKSRVSRWLNEDQRSEPGQEYLDLLAARFGVSVEKLYAPPGGSDAPAGVPIVGKAGAGPDGSVLFAHSDGDFGEAEPPPQATADTRALEVEGQSMRGVADDGSLIFYDGQEPPNDTHVGELCICWLEDDRVLIKYPFHGSAAGLWNLESTTAATMRDQAVRLMAHVTGIVPRRAARALVRRRLDIRPVDTVISSR